MRGVFSKTASLGLLFAAMFCAAGNAESPSGDGRGRCARLGGDFVAVSGGEGCVRIGGHVRAEIARTEAPTQLKKI